MDKKKGLVSRGVVFQFLLVLVPTILWGGTFALRPWNHTRCLSHPEACSKQSVLAIDRLSIGMEDPQADEYSFETQSLSGTLAFIGPAAWSLSQFALGSLSLPVALTTAAWDTVTVLQAVTWNGFFTEAAHFLSQRPRPFVLMDPATRGADPAHYVSFYSGHTSFVAVTQIVLFLILLGHQAPKIVLFLSLSLGECLIFSTAYFRILAGRHFLTDTLWAIVAGGLTAWLVVYWRKRTTLFSAKK